MMLSSRSRALKKRNLANKVHVVKDGAEALEFIFGTGTYAERNINQIPKVILLDLKLPKCSMDYRPCG